MDQWTPRNPEFYTKVKSFVEAAIKTLAPIAREIENLPYQKREKITILNDSSWEFEEETIADWEFFIQTSDEITHLTEFMALDVFMKNDPVISNHINKRDGTINARTRMTCLSYMSFLLCQQLEHLLIGINDSNYHLLDFKRNYQELEDFFYTDTISLRAICFLTNFQMNLDEIHLNDQFLIQKLSDADLEALINKQFPVFPDSIRGFMFSHYIFEIQYQIRKVCCVESSPSQFKVRLNIHTYDKLLDQLITSLRLFKHGDLQCSGVVILPPKGHNFSIMTSFDTFQHIDTGGDIYKLEKEEVSEFNKFFLQYTLIDPLKLLPISVPLRRLNFAYERPLLEDKLIDYVIAFEALFFKSGESGELTHKLAVRVARLLSQTYEERAAIHKEMKDIYGIRSKIVHGEVTTISREVVTKAEGILRKSLKVLLGKMPIPNYDELISHLDLD